MERGVLHVKPGAPSFCALPKGFRWRELTYAERTSLRDVCIYGKPCMSDSVDGSDGVGVKYRVCMAVRRYKRDCLFRASLILALST